MGGTRFASVRAAATRAARVASTACWSRSARRAASTFTCSRSTSGLIRRISSGWATVPVWAFTPTIFFSPFSSFCW
jgi:hypothetical protein